MANKTPPAILNGDRCSHERSLQTSNQAIDLQVYPRDIRGKAIPILRELNINSFPDEILLKIFSLINAPNQRLCELKFVCRRWNTIINTPELWRLSKYDPNMTDVKLIKITRGCPWLQQIDLHNCNFITNIGLKQLASVCHNLRYLDLSACKGISSTGIVELVGKDVKQKKGNKRVRVAEHIEGCPKLEYIDLSECKKLTDHVLTSLAIGCKKIRYIDLSNCILITDAGIENFAQNCPNLEFVILSDKSARLPKITDKSLIALSQYCPNLKYVDIQGLKNISPIGIAALIRSCPNLETLLTIYSFIDEDLKMLGEIPSKLKWIQMDCLYATHEGLIAFFKNKNHYLQIIKLISPRNILPTIMKEIGQACPNLREIYIKDFLQFRDKDLFSLVDSCTYLEKIIFNTFSGITQMGMAHIKKERPNLQLIYTDDPEYFTKKQKNIFRL